MKIETLLFKEVVVFPELFIGIAIIYLVIHSTFLSIQKNYPLLQTSILYLSVLSLFFSVYLVFNEHLNVLEASFLNNTYMLDYVSLFSKGIIGSLSILCLIMMKSYIIKQKINQFEYLLLILFSVLGLFLLCSANDFLTAYLAIELQSLAFYVLAAFKKNSTFSVDAGIKYFILGSFASSLFLFGSSLLYGFTGTVCFNDFHLLFLEVFNKQSNLTEADITLADLHDFVLNLTRVEMYNKFDISLVNLNETISKEEIESGRAELEKLLPTLATLKLFELAGAFSGGPINFDSLIKMYTDYKQSNLTEADITLADLHDFVLNLTRVEMYNKFDISLVNLNETISKEEIESGRAELEKLLPTLATLKLFELTGAFSGGPISFDSLIKMYIDYTTIIDVNIVKFSLGFIFISLFFKLTVAPFHIWAPDVYEGSPSSSTFFFSVVPKLAIFVLLLRIFYYSFYCFVDSWRYFIVIIVVFSIIVGSFGGLEQRKLKTLLVYSTISHMGYSLIAFSAGTFESFQMLFSYLIIYSFSGLCIWSIFLITKIKTNYLQKQNKDLTDLVLLSKSNYMLAIFFTVVLFSVAGFPPMIGFLVKMGIFVTAIESSMYFVALISILCSVIGTFYYLRLIKILYFEKVIVGKLYYPINSQDSIVITLLFYLFLFLFINPTLLFLLSYKFSLLIFA